MELPLAPLLVACVFTRARESITAPALLGSSALATYARVNFHHVIAYFKLTQLSFFLSLKVCDCNGHSDICDPVTTDCGSCSGNTEGNHCESCITGYSRSSGNLTGDCTGT